MRDTSAGVLRLDEAVMGDAGGPAGDSVLAEVICGPRLWKGPSPSFYI